MAIGDVVKKVADTVKKAVPKETKEAVKKAVDTVKDTATKAVQNVSGATSKTPSQKREEQKADTEIGKYCRPRPSGAKTEADHVSADDVSKAVENVRREDTSNISPVSGQFFNGTTKSTTTTTAPQMQATPDGSSDTTETGETTEYTPSEVAQAHNLTQEQDEAVQKITDVSTFYDCVGLNEADFRESYGLTDEDIAELNSYSVEDLKNLAATVFEQTNSVADQSGGVEAKIIDRSSSSRSGIDVHDGVTVQNGLADESGVTGTKLDIDKYYDQYHGNYSGICDEYKTKVGEDIKADIVSYYGIEADADGKLTEAGEAKLLEVYQGIASQVGCTEKPADMSLDDYVKAVNDELATRSWNGDLSDDYIDLPTKEVSEDTAQTEQTEQTDQSAQETETEETATTTSNNGIDYSVVSSPNLESGQNPDSKLGFAPNMQNNSISVAEYENLTVSDNRKKPYDESGKPVPGTYSMKDEKGNKYTVEISDDTKSYKVSQEVEQDDGTKVKVETNYNVSSNTYSQKAYDEEGKLLEGVQTKYDDNGNLEETRNYFDGSSDGYNSCYKVTLSDGNEYICKEKLSADGSLIPSYFDSKGGYEFDSVEKAMRATDVMKAYEVAGADSMTPSQKLLVGFNDIPDIDTVMKGIQNGEYMDTNFAQMFDNYKTDYTNLNGLSEDEQNNVKQMMEYYDIIQTIGEENLSPVDKGILRNFESYFGYLCGHQTYTGDSSKLLGNLRVVCNNLDVNMTSLDSSSSFNNGEYDSDGIEFTRNIKDDDGNIISSVTMNTKKYNGVDADIQYTPYTAKTSEETETTDTDKTADTTVETADAPASGEDTSSETVSDTTTVSDDTATDSTTTEIDTNLVNSLVDKMADKFPSISDSISTPAAEELIKNGTATVSLGDGSQHTLEYKNGELYIDGELYAESEDIDELEDEV